MAKKTTRKKAKRPEGRPTDYRPTFPQKVLDYIERCETTEEGKERELPTRASVANMLNVSLVTIDTWGKKYPEFLCSLEKLHQSQQKHLINRGLNGTGNSTIAKLLLSANHGIHEKTETDHGITDDLAELMKEIGASGKGLPIKT